MSNTKKHHLSRLGVAANITLVATFSLVTAFMISHPQDMSGNPESVVNSHIVKDASLEQAIVGDKDADVELAQERLLTQEGRNSSF